MEDNGGKFTGLVSGNQEHTPQCRCLKVAKFGNIEELSLG